MCQVPTPVMITAETDHLEGVWRWPSRRRSGKGTYRIWKQKRWQWSQWRSRGVLSVRTCGGHWRDKRACWKKKAQWWWEESTIIIFSAFKCPRHLRSSLHLAVLFYKWEEKNAELSLTWYDTHGEQQGWVKLSHWALAFPCRPCGKVLGRTGAPGAN